MPVHPPTRRPPSPPIRRLQPRDSQGAAILLTASGLLLGACAGWSGSRCADTSGLNNDLTPVELSLEAAVCAQRGDLGAAGLRYGLAMAFSSFDNKRGGDGDPPGWKGTRMMLPQLVLSSRLRPEQLAALLNDFKAVTEPGPRHRELCDLLRRVGPPIYPHDYAVNEQMQVVRPKQASDGSAADSRTENHPGFDTKAAWTSVLTKVVECSRAAA